MGTGRMAKRHEEFYRLYQRGQGWYTYISFTTETGERVQFRGSCGTTDRNKAEQFCINKINQIQKQATIKSGGYVAVTVDETFGRYYVEKAQYQTRPKQAMTRLKNLKQWLNVEYLHQINEPIISSMVANIRNTMSNATVNRYLALLSVVLNTAIDEWHYECRHIKMSKFKLTEPAENVKYLKDWDTLELIVSKAPQWMKPFIYTAIYTGMRLGNLLELKWENIDFVNKVINIKVKDKNKLGGKNHTIPIIPELENILNNINRTSEFVFVNSQNNPVKFITTTWNDIFYKWELVKDLNTIKDSDIILHRKRILKDGKIKDLTYKRVLKDKNLPYINFHTLRHTCGTWQAKAGVNAMIIKEVLGHKDIRTTKKYVHADDAQKRGALLSVFSQSCTKLVQDENSKKLND